MLLIIVFPPPLSLFIIVYCCLLLLLLLFVCDSCWAVVLISLVIPLFSSCLFLFGSVSIFGGVASPHWVEKGRGFNSAIKTHKHSLLSLSLSLSSLSLSFSHFLSFSHSPSLFYILFVLLFGNFILQLSSSFVVCHVKEASKDSNVVMLL